MLVCFQYSNLNQQNEDDFLVAREKVKAFKSWLEGE